VPQKTKTNILAYIASIHMYVKESSPFGGNIVWSHVIGVAL